MMTNKKWTPRSLRWTDAERQAKKIQSQNVRQIRWLFWRESQALREEIQKEISGKYHPRLRGGYGWIFPAPDGHFKDAAQLRAELAPVVGDASTSVMQCGSGVTACHNLLALEVAGLPGAKLYPGSWSEWVADPKRPVATGS